MTKVRFPLDRSAAFSVLLEVDADYAESDARETATLDAFMAAWYEDSSPNMYEFAKRWVAERSADV